MERNNNYRNNNYNNDRSYNNNNNNNNRDREGEGGHHGGGGGGGYNNHRGGGGGGYNNHRGGGGGGGYNNHRGGGGGGYNNHRGGGGGGYNNHRGGGGGGGFNNNPVLSGKRENVQLVCNYKKINIVSSDTHIHLYYIKTNPELPCNSKVIYDIAKKIKSYLKDLLGFFFLTDSVIYATKEASVDEDNNIYSSKVSIDDKEYDVNISKTKGNMSYNKEDSLQSKQFLEKIISSILNANKSLMRFNRENYFDHRQTEKLGNFSMMPGFSTAVSISESGVPMLRISTKNKLLSDLTCLDKIHSLKDPDKIKEYFIGNSVIANYANKKVYKIDDVAFNKNPSNVTIDVRDRSNKESIIKKNLIDYYKETYDKQIRDRNQPLLIFKRTRNNVETENYLIPELCLLSGIDDELKEDDSFKKQVGKTRSKPDQKMKEINNFLSYFNNSNNNNGSSISPKEIKERWGIEIEENFVSFEGKGLEPPKLKFGNKEVDINNGKFRSEKAVKADTIKKWAVVTDGNKFDVEKILASMRSASDKLGIDLSSPKVFYLDRNETWNNFILKSKEELRNYDIVLTMLNNNSHKIYKEVKTLFLTNIKVPNQCLHIMKHKGGNLSSVSGVLNQMVVKTKGALFNIELANINDCFKKPSAIVGIEVISSSKQDVKYSFCSTVDRYHNKIFTENIFKLKTNNENENNSNLNSKENNSKTNSNSLNYSTHPINEFVSKLLKEFKMIPSTIIFYRSGVNQQMFNNIINSEVEPLKKYMEDLFNRLSDDDKKKHNLTEPPRFAFLIVNKRVDIKFFECSNYDVNRNNDVNNPGAGLVVDTTVTSNSFDEFYIQPQYVNQGTATPTKFSVLHNDCNGLSKTDLEKVSFYMCFYYWNWSGAIRVPSVLKFSELCSKFSQLNLDNKEVSSRVKNSPYFI